MSTLEFVNVVDSLVQRAVGSSGGELRRDEGWRLAFQGVCGAFLQGARFAEVGGSRSGGGRDCCGLVSGVIEQLRVVGDVDGYDGSGGASESGSAVVDGGGLRKQSVGVVSGDGGSGGCVGNVYESLSGGSRSCDSALCSDGKVAEGSYGFVRESVGGDGHGDSGDRERAECGVRAEHDDVRRFGESVAGDNSGSGLNGEVRGKNWRTNKMKRERRKQKRAECYSAATWRRGAAGPSTASVVTVDSRTAEEIEAVRTLAIRRAAENKVAAALAEHRLRSLQDEDKTVAVRRLEAARLEQRINDAKAKSQASYKKCDNSLKSLGSTGSAGEFALKQVVTESESLKKEVESLRRQVEVALAAGGPAAYAAVAKLPEPKKCGIRDVMNPPDASWSREETDAYYAIVDEEDNGNYNSNWADFFPSGRLTEEEMEAEAAMYMHG